MNTLLAPLWEISEFEEIQKQLDKESGCVALTGCIESQKLHMAYGLSEGRFQNRIFVTYSDQRIKELLEDERFYDRESFIRRGILFSIRRIFMEISLRRSALRRCAGFWRESRLR